MSFETRLQKGITKKEAQMEKEKQKIDILKEKLDSGKITRAKFNIQKKHHEEIIKAMSSRMRTLQGGLTREKRNQEEKAEKKKEKEEEKQKKKEKKKSND
jgi:ribosomal protein L12E/L44/L45/RPP1/RPP2